MNINNKTDYKVSLFYVRTAKNQQQYTLVAKVNYQFDRNAKLTMIKNGEPIFPCDLFRLNYNNSSIISAEESMPYKQGSELLVYATLRVTHDKLKTTQAMLGILKNKTQCEKKLIGFSRRSWKKCFLRNRIKTFGFVEPVPISYEYAFGGADPIDSSKIFHENPIGTGYSFYYKGIDGLELPQLEYAQLLISSLKDQPKPVGLGPVPKFYASRLQSCVAQGTNQFNMAPLDQQFNEPFLAGDEIYFSGFQSILGPAQNRITIPETKIAVSMNGEKIVFDKDKHCDTVILNLNANTLSFIYRFPILIEEDFQSNYILVEF